MNHLPNIKFFSELRTLSRASLDEGAPVHRANLWHKYLKLSVAHDLEYPKTVSQGKLFLNLVADATAVAARVASLLGGQVMEVQGSMIHLGLPHTIDEQQLKYAAGLLHHLLHKKLSQRKGLHGWRMCADFGKTLVVRWPIAHGDPSLVSIGDAANEPAKHLYDQLSRRVENQTLKNHHLGVRTPGTKKWRYIDLVEAAMISARNGLELPPEPEVRAETMMLSAGQLETKTYPVGSPSDGTSPTTDDPLRLFACVLRADLDGFTARVRDCADTDEAMGGLAKHFIEVMEETRRFVENYDNRDLIQLPWAGDNCTLALVHEARDSYEHARGRGPTDTAIDFDRTLRPAVEDAGLDGWAYGIAGGHLENATTGNFQVGRIFVGEEAFLVAAGEGVGRSLQAFSHINPDLDEVVLWHEDVDELLPIFSRCFSPATKPNNETSTLFQTASLKRLGWDANTALANTTRRTLPGTETKPQTVTQRPYLSDDFRSYDYSKTSQAVAKRRAAARPDPHLAGAFCDTLASRLEEGVCSCVDGGTLRVRGFLPLSLERALIEIRVNPRTDWVLRDPPQVWCREPWVRVHGDWHVYDDHSLCWIMEPEWTDFVFRSADTASGRIGPATRILFQWVESLLVRHLIADQEGLTEWPRDRWPDWSHGHLGRLEYKRKLRREAKRDGFKQRKRKTR